MVGQIISLTHVYDIGDVIRLIAHQSEELYFLQTVRYHELKSHSVHSICVKICQHQRRYTLRAGCLNPLEKNVLIFLDFLSDFLRELVDFFE